MRYRRQDPDGDYVFGAQNEFYVDSPEAVAQAILTRLRLARGEWALDLSAGTPWFTDVLGKNTTRKYDRAIRERILGTSGVKSLQTYGSSLNRSARKLSISARVITQYGAITVATNIPIPQ